MKPKYITADNYKEFSPSEFVRSFASDLERTGKKTINMGTYFQGTAKQEKCLPCLGAIACSNMGISIKGNYSWDPTTSAVARLGNAIRRTDYYTAVEKLRDLYGASVVPFEWNGIKFDKLMNLKHKHKSMIGYIDQDLKERLIKQVHQFADFLEKEGL